ncbi:MAG: FecR domain-containing protein [Rubripirellula sp.]
MNSPSPAYDPQKLHELASAALEGTANESQLQELTKLLRESTAARDEYLKLMDLHAVLSTELVVDPSTPPIPSTPPTRKTIAVDEQVESSVAPTNRGWLPLTVAAALAACLLIAVTWFRPNGSTAEPESFASIAQGTDAVWQSDTVTVGDRIGATTLRLKSGIVRLEFDSGVEVTLEGPAEFELFAVEKTQLVSGLLTATVPPGAEGFTVDTPSAQVIDLGTSFGIDIGADGFSKVTVFDGEVEIAPRDATEKRLLSEGESVRIGTNYEVEDITFDPKPFEKMWPTASGIAGSSESIRFVPPWPKQIRFVQSDDQIFVRPEGHPVRLNTELMVNISEPGDYENLGDLSPSLLQSNTSVRSYILHFSPESQLGRRRAKRVTGSITFARPVLGMMVSHDELAASSHRFGRRGAGEGNQRRELNLTADRDGDRITLSDDRKTVTLDLMSPGRSSDLVRVIVESNGRFHRMRRNNQGGRMPPP